MSKEYKIRLQIIATANDNGTNAAVITASQVTNRIGTLDQVFAPAGIKFLFDESSDFLTINSTLANRDFTVLEEPNAGTLAWDHVPAIDAEPHSKARTDLAKLYPGKLVVIYRNRTQLTMDEDTGYWKVSGRGGGSSGENAHYVNMSTISNATDLAHEIGHYLQLPHPFVQGVETVADAAARIKKFVEDGGSKEDGLDALDGDRFWVLDTPADCRGKIFESLERDVCTGGEIPIPVVFSDHSIKTYTLAPDRSLVMSYFKGCPGAKTISPQQARRVRDGLELRFRHDLISLPPSPGHTLARGATGTAGAIEEVDIALVRDGRVATAVHDGAGNMKVIVWDIENDGTKIIRRGSASAKAVVAKVSLCNLGLNMLATAVRDVANHLIIIVWRVEENGEVTYLDSTVRTEQIKDVAIEFVAMYNTMATLCWHTDGTTSVDIWRVAADGKISHKEHGHNQYLTLGTAKAIGPICALAEGSFVTYQRDGEDMLRSVLWRYAKGGLVPLMVTRFEGSTISKLSASTITRELTIAAVRDKDNALRLVAYRFPEGGLYIEEKGKAAAGSVGDIAVCRVGTEMAVTAVKDGANHLKVILWQVGASGSQLIRLKDATTDETFSRLAICQTSTNQFATALRDGAGNLKIIVWRLLPKIPIVVLPDNFTSLAASASPSANRSADATAEDLARGGECDEEPGT